MGAWIAASRQLLQQGRKGRQGWQLFVEFVKCKKATVALQLQRRMQQEQYGFCLLVLRLGGEGCLCFLYPYKCAAAALFVCLALFLAPLAAVVDIVV